MTKRFKTSTNFAAGTLLGPILDFDHEQSWTSVCVPDTFTKPDGTQNLLPVWVDGWFDRNALKLRHGVQHWAVLAPEEFPVQVPTKSAPPAKAVPWGLHAPP